MLGQVLYRQNQVLGVETFKEGSQLSPLYLLTQPPDHEQGDLKNTLFLLAGHLSEHSHTDTEVTHAVDHT